jgi:hypothetical protein
VVIHSTGAVTISGAILVTTQVLTGWGAMPANAQVAGGTAMPAMTFRHLLHPGPVGGQNTANLSGLLTPSSSGLGGGTFTIVAEGAISISGEILANGGNGSADSNCNSYGGGGGGIIILASKTSISNTGTLSANGGAGTPASTSCSVGPYDPGGGGGGGVIHLIAPSGQISSGTVHVTGGASGTLNGGGFATGGGAGGGNGGAVGSSGSGGYLFSTNVADPTTIFVP